MWSGGTLVLVITRYSIEREYNKPTLKFLLTCPIILDKFLSKNELQRDGANEQESSNNGHNLHYVIYPVTECSDMDDDKKTDLELP